VGKRGCNPSSKVPRVLRMQRLIVFSDSLNRGSRHNALLRRSAGNGTKTNSRKGFPGNYSNCGAQLCGLDPREASEAARDGYARGLTDNQRPTAFQEQEEACSLPEIVWGAHYIKNGIPRTEARTHLRHSPANPTKCLLALPRKACKSFLAIRLALAYRVRA